MSAGGGGVTRLVGRLNASGPDAVLALTLTALGLVQAGLFPIAAPGLGPLFVLGSTLPLAWRRTRPAVACAVSSTFWLVPLQGYPVLGFVTAILYFSALGTSETRRGRQVVTAAWGTGCGLVGTWLGPEPPQALIGAALVVLAPLAGGLAVRHQRRQRDALESLTRELAAERRLVQEAAAGAERARIAQELHDVLGHEVTLIAIQAEAAAAALAVDPQRATAPVESIRITAHRTLAEIRSTLDLLATGDHDAYGVGDPVEELRELSARAERSGIAHRLTVNGLPWPGQAAAWLAVNRIVRECLTNAGRHGSGQPADVTVTWGPDCVEVRAVNPVSPRARVAPSRGLSGMRHRAELLGGSFGARIDGTTFVVSARIPNPASRPARGVA